MLKTDALLYFGSKTKLAQAAGIRLASLYSWKGDLVPEGRAMRLQEASGGELQYDPKVYDEYEVKKALSLDYRHWIISVRLPYSERPPRPSRTFQQRIWR
ncbi:TPA: hypothetical protein JL174_003513 [Escherichia coli]|nr:hypothetical protein [Escherichia coli]HAW6398289.1 hypothetical protein [Escherichia coli]